MWIRKKNYRTQQECIFNLNSTIKALKEEVVELKKLNPPPIKDYTIFTSTGNVKVKANCHFLDIYNGTGLTFYINGEIVGRFIQWNNFVIDRE
jgi:hypothetical protein